LKKGGKPKDAKNKNWRAEGFVTTGNEFEPGLADFVPGWFATGHTVITNFLQLLQRMLKHTCTSLKISLCISPQSL
jgi:hypothetical protein